MIRLFNWGAIILYSAIVFTYGCSKDENNDDNGNPEKESLSFNTNELLDRLPDGLTTSNDVQAQLAVGQINSALSWTGFMSGMEPTDDAIVVGDDYSWSFPVGNDTYTYFYNFREESGRKYWTSNIQINGGPVMTYIEAWESADGKMGELQYNFNWICASQQVPGSDACPVINTIYSWEIDEKDTYHFEWYTEAEDESMVQSQQMELMADGSGFVKFFIGGELYQHTEWDALGNGTWKTYSGGQLIDQGSWGT